MQATDILTLCRLVNFEGIRDTGNLRLTSLTVFIGNNGSGKSSVVEGLWTLIRFVVSYMSEVRA